MFSGYDPLRASFIWTLRRCCGIAARCTYPQDQIINPGEMSPANSIEIAIWWRSAGMARFVAILGVHHERRAQLVAVAFQYSAVFLGAIFIGGGRCSCPTAWWGWSASFASSGATGRDEAA